MKSKFADRLPLKGAHERWRDAPDGENCDALVRALRHRERNGKDLWRVRAVVEANA